MNMSGAVCHQLNILFEFDRQKYDELVSKCKEIQQKYINNQNFNDNNEQSSRGEYIAQSENRRHIQANLNKLQDEKVIQQVSNTQSQFMSSYGGEIYDAEGSEMDYLDNEVSNIARKLQQKKKM